jgi:hypothetical protein
MIADSLHTSLRTDHLVWLLGDGAKWLGESDTNKPFKNKIQFINFLKLFINNLIFFCGQKSSWK